MILKDQAISSTEICPALPQKLDGTNKESWITLNRVQCWNPWLFAGWIGNIDVISAFHDYSSWVNIPGHPSLALVKVLWVPWPLLFDWLIKLETFPVPHWLCMVVAALPWSLCHTWRFAGHFINISFEPHNNPGRCGAILIPSLWLRKRRQRLVKSHTASECVQPHMSSGLPDSRFSILFTVPPAVSKWSKTLRQLWFCSGEEVQY